PRARERDTPRLGLGGGRRRKCLRPFRGLTATLSWAVRRFCDALHYEGACDEGSLGSAEGR
ncbi:hypothetical protein, partial [Methylobacterium sp. WL18]|uniref:hypothetical protein n=1 Tax=Methylobacterium sp. WL18 TaxID=2603897 RepID=UPI001AED848B